MQREHSAFIGAEPSPQEYLYGAESHEGSMTISTTNSAVSAMISTFSHDGRGTCEFDGTLVDTDRDGWYESENPEDGISILFMQNRAELPDFGQYSLRRLWLHGRRIYGPPINGFLHEDLKRQGGNVLRIPPEDSPCPPLPRCFGNIPCEYGCKTVRLRPTTEKQCKRA